MKMDTVLNDASIQLTPGGLIQKGETIQISSTVSGQLRICFGASGGFEVLRTEALSVDEPFEWLAENCGQYLVVFIPADGSDVLRRPCAVVDSTWSVCQITVGAFTAEDFAELVHDSGVAVDYYVGLGRKGHSREFTAHDPRWHKYERLHGDVIHPHVMASSLNDLFPELTHDDPNWESLPQTEIENRLRALQDWWCDQGYGPLDRIATYTPCNPLVQACKATGIRVIHSLCSEQNWSDGEWAINHWGMPTAPYWIAGDDFRKAGQREATGVMGVIMNHYQVLLPHLTHWGDFVLSPSHFTRWIRAADCGEESTRFRQFLKDTVQGGSPVSDAPFFFVAGFEFGRTFGTANMTAYNRAGLSRLLELGKTEKLVFATSSDVRAYYDRHVEVLPDRIFRQRDNWVGVTVNGKPGQAGDSVVLERSAYKALIREDSHLPFFYYDYTVPWDFETADTDAPDDFSNDCATSLLVEHLEKDRLSLFAKNPLKRAIPIAVWDAVLDGAPEFEQLPVKRLDDGRVITLLEVPAGWCGCAELMTCRREPPRLLRSDGRWMLQSFGTGEDLHTYLYLDAPLTRALSLPVALKRTSRVEDAKGPFETLEAGSHELAFGPLQNWYRFWGCSVEDLEPTDEVDSILGLSGVLVGPDAVQLSSQHFEALDAQAWSQSCMAGKDKALTVHCGAGLAFGTRSRSASHDEVIAHQPGLHASEYADGVMSFGPGLAFWYHPRGLHFRIYGLGDVMKTGELWTLLLNSYDPLRLGARYEVAIGRQHRSLGKWTLPNAANESAAFFPVEFTVEDLDEKGRLTVSVRSDQKALVHWWKEGGFIAAIHAVWLAR